MAAVRESAADPFGRIELCNERKREPARDREYIHTLRGGNTESKQKERDKEREIE